VLESEFGVKLSKSLQRCDWSRRPLTPPQINYAAEDVAHLVALRDRLLPDLRTRGREHWAREENEALSRLAPAPVREPSDFLRAKGAWDLDGRALAVLRELFALRDEWARTADLPLFKIVTDAKARVRECTVADIQRRVREQSGRNAAQVGNMRETCHAVICRVPIKCRCQDMRCVARNEKRVSVSRNLYGAVRRPEANEDARHGSGRFKRRTFIATKRRDAVATMRKSDNPAGPRLGSGLRLPRPDIRPGPSAKRCLFVKSED
jgi:hypothetical protein